MPPDDLAHIAAAWTRADVVAELERQREDAAAKRLADNWQEHYRALDRPRQAWADLLMREPWHWFVTLTFKPAQHGPTGGMHPERADKAYRLLAHSIEEELYGRRWQKRRGPLGGLVWARGQEFHKDGRIHFHALLSSLEGDLSQYARRLSWMDWWYGRFGIARIEPPDAQEDVAGYVSKYVVKGGEVDVSDNFGKRRPPALLDHLPSWSQGWQRGPASKGDRP